MNDDPTAQHDSGDDDRDEALDPAAMLALADRQQRSMEARMAGFVPVIMTTWGVAWLLGFGALWLIDGLAPAFALPAPVAVAVFVFFLAVAIGLSAWLGIRSGRGIRSTPNSAFQGAVYGITWWAGSLGIGAIGGGLGANGMSSELANFYYPSAFVLFAGVMYIFAGVIWHAVPSVVLGAWTIAIAAAAPFFGHPGNYLFLAIAGGAGYLALGIASLVRLRRMRGPAPGGSASS